MKTTVLVPIHGLRETGQKIQANFPPRCVYCGAPATTQTLVDVSGGQQRGRTSVSYSAQLLLPYCLEHALVNQQYKRLMAIIGIPLFLIVFAGWFFLMMPFAALVETLPINIIFLPLIFPCIGNLLLGMAAIVVLHGILLLLFPRFRDIPSVGQDGALGVTIKLQGTLWGATGLEFTFTNADYAAEFTRVNETAPVTPPAQANTALLVGTAAAVIVLVLLMLWLLNGAPGVPGMPDISESPTLLAAFGAFALILAGGLLLLMVGTNRRNRGQRPGPHKL